MAITNTIETRTTGDNDDAVQVFVENAIIDPPVKVNSPFNFEVPVYSLNGATFKFYTQDTDGISTNLNNTKSLTFSFTANTPSLSGFTQMLHDIYRLDFATFDDVADNGTGATLFEEAVSAITVPFLTMVEDTSGSTFTVLSAHTLDFPVKVKPAGQFTQDMLMDKSQYFVDSKFFFPKAIDPTLGEVQTISDDSIATLYAVPTGTTEFLTSSGRPHQITGGTFSGFTVNGAYFTYFSPPHKPDINVDNGQPQVSGSLSTFSPIFAFRNVDDGDYYRLQVNYNTGDTSFTGSTTVFRIESQAGDPEFVRTYSTPLTPNANFIYRVGNTKEITNIFGIKQNVTVWSEYAAARTSNDGQFVLSGNTYKSIIGGNRVSGATITLTIQSTISNVDLGADSIEDPDILSEITSPLGGGVGTTITVGPTTVAGTYTFGRINGGTYTVTAAHPNFVSQTATITLTQDTQLDFVFSILWGDTVVTFIDTETFI